MGLSNCTATTSVLGRASSVQDTIRVSVLGVLLLCAVLTIGCSSVTSHDAVIDRLEGRGPVALSSDNPFLAANLLLTRETERSAELKGFLEHRGHPDALEVESHLLSPTIIRLFYVAAREDYEMEASDSTWVIRGPYATDSSKLEDLSALYPGTPSPAHALKANDSASTLPAQSSEGPEEHPAARSDPFLGKLEEAYQKRAEQGAFRSPASGAPPPHEVPVDGPEIPPHQEDKDPGVARAKTPSASFPPRDTAEQTAKRTAPSVTTRSDEETTFIRGLIEREGSSKAEITPKGDVVHYVTLPGETLSIIARWYTLDRGNASRLARINELKNPDQMRVGDIVIIPSYLVKNKQRLRDGALRELQMKYQSGAELRP